MRVLGMLAVVVLAAALAGCNSSAARTTKATTSHPKSVPIDQVRPSDRANYRFDLAHGARVVRDPATRTLVVESTSPARAAEMIATVHGHNDSAFRQYRNWQPYAARHHLGLVAVEWQTRWGRDAQFLDTRSTYDMIRRAVRREGTTPGRVLLHGFSQGSHESFALTALDRAGPRLFAMTLAESGGDGEAPIHEPAFAGTRWDLYCAGKDPWPQLSGCPAMRRAQTLLTRSGATVTRLMLDPPAHHGGLVKNQRDVELALSDFARAAARR
jgi:predicted esterase